MHLLGEKDYNSDNTNYPINVNTDVNYKTYDEAIAYFCVYCGIQDADKYFPQILSISLFPDEILKALAINLKKLNNIYTIGRPSVKIKKNFL